MNINYLFFNRICLVNIYLKIENLRETTLSEFHASDVLFWIFLHQEPSKLNIESLEPKHLKGRMTKTDLLLMTNLS